MSKYNLTKKDTERLKEYLKAIEDHAKNEPEKIAPETWDKAMSAIKAAGEIPAEYRDIIGETEITTHSEIKDGNHQYIPEGKTKKGYYDIVWERWNAEFNELFNKYHDVIIKGLNYAISQGNNSEGRMNGTIETLQKLLSDIKAAPAVMAKEPKDVKFPIDKVNKDIWNLLEYNTGGQITFQRYNVATPGKNPIDILFSLDFSDFQNVLISKKLEPYDKRVYISVGALFDAGYDIVTIQNIYNAMGYTGRVGAADIKKINNALTKLAAARILIDNLNEANANESKYPHFKYDGSLLPMERIQAIINGQTIEAAIHVFRYPPMLDFAKQRKQITAVNIKLLDTPLNKTNENIAIEDYLLEEIARIKNKKRNNKMLYQTICENAGIKSAKQQKRAQEKIKKLLKYYQDCGHILSFKEQKDGIIINY